MFRDEGSELNHYFKYFFGADGDSDALNKSLKVLVGFDFRVFGLSSE